jgi:hypothetical protein
MRKFFRIFSITVASILFCWYLSLYFSESSGSFEVIDSPTKVNKCVLDETSWILKSPVLFNGKDQTGVYLGDGLAENPETKLWYLNPSSRTCDQVSDDQVRNKLQQITSSEEKIFPIVEPPIFTRGHVIQSTQYQGSVSARWLFRGLRLKRPVYYISFMGGGAHWGIASSYIGSFYLEVYRGKEKIFVIGKSVYGATWGPSLTGDYLTYDAFNRSLIFMDKFNERGVVYWTRLKE